MYNCSDNCELYQKLLFDNNTLQKQLESGTYYLKSQLLKQVEMEIGEIRDTLQYLDTQDKVRIDRRLRNIESILRP